MADVATNALEWLVSGGNDEDFYGEHVPGLIETGETTLGRRMMHPRASR